MATTKKVAVTSAYYGNTANGDYTNGDTNHLYVGKYGQTTYRSRLTIPALSSIAEIGTDRISITSIKLYVRGNDGANSFSVKFGCSAASMWGASMSKSKTVSVVKGDSYQMIDLTDFASAVAGYTSKWYLHMQPSSSSPTSYIRIDSTSKAKKPYLEITWQKVAATISGDKDSAVLGTDTVTFTITPEVENETHTLIYSIGDRSEVIAAMEGNTITWTPSLSLAYEIPNDDSDTVEISMYAYDSASNLQRTETYYQTVSVPANVKPSISDAGISFVNALSGYLLAGRSEILIAPTVEMTGAYNASIKEITAALNGTTIVRWTEFNEIDPGVFSVTAVSTGVLAQGTASLSITVTDSRGRTATATSSYTVRAYSPPEIARFSVERYEPVYDANETITGYVASDVGNKIWVNLSIVKASVKPSTTELNTLSWTIEGKSASGSTMTRSGTTQTLTQDRSQFSSTVSEDETWTFTITVTDAAGSTVKQYSVVAPGHAAFSISPDKWGAAIGMISNGTKANPMFEVAGGYESHFYGGAFGADGYRLDRVGQTALINFDSTTFEIHDSARVPRISRVGPIVFMDGALQSKSSIASGSKVNVATLPEWARPAQVVSSLQQGKTLAIYWIVVYPDGKLEFSRYRNGSSNAAIDAGGQLSMTACWIAAN